MLLGTLPFGDVVPGRVELPTSTLSVWRSNQLSYETVGTSANIEYLIHNKVAKDLFPCNYLVH